MIAAAYGLYLIPLPQMKAQQVIALSDKQTQYDASIKQKVSESITSAKEGNQVTENGWIKTDKGWTYQVGNLTLKDTWVADDSYMYYLDSTGIMLTGLQVLHGNEYYFSEDGHLCTNGFYDINGQTHLLDKYGSPLYGYQLYDGNRYYMDESGVLLRNATTPDGIYNVDETGKIASVNMEKVTTDCPLKNAPGTSGYLIGGYPLELFMVSMAGETSGARITIGDKGRAYGLCQFDYRYDLTDFINYAYETHPALWFEFEQYINKYAKGDEELIGNPGILHAFQTAESLSSVNYASDQAEFLYRRYFENTYKTLENAGFCLSQRNIAISAAIMSVNINCGSQTGLYLSRLSPNMTDEEMINAIYALRNTVLTANGKGTNTRFRVSEPQLVHQLSAGEVNANSSFVMAGGVAWDDRVLKYCGQYLTDEEIKERYAEIGVSPYSNQIEEPAEVEAIEEIEPISTEMQQSTEMANESETTSQVIVSDFRKSSVSHTTSEQTETLPAETSPTIIMGQQ